MAPRCAAIAVIFCVYELIVFRFHFVVRGKKHLELVPNCVLNCMKFERGEIRRLNTKYEFLGG